MVGRYIETDVPGGGDPSPDAAKDGRGQRLRAGIYFLKLEIGKKSEAVKIMVRP